MNILAILWRAADAGEAVPLYTVPGRVASVAGDTLVVGDSRHRRLTAYTLSTGELIWSRRLGHPGRRRRRWALEVGIIGDRVYTAGDDNTSRMLESGRRAREHGYRLHDASVRAGLWLERSSDACVLSGYDEARLADCETGVALAGPELPKNGVSKNQDRPWQRPRRWSLCGHQPPQAGTLPVGLERGISVVAVYESDTAALVGIQQGAEHFRTPLPGEVVWSTEQVGSMCIALTIGGGIDGFHSALSGADCADGQGRWSVDLSPHRPQLWQIDGTLVVRLDDGTVLGFDPADGRERFHHALGEETLPWFEGDIVERRTSWWPLPLEGTHIASIDVATGALGEVRPLPASSRLSESGGVQILWFVLDEHVEVMLDLGGPSQRWALPEGALLWDGALLWVVGIDKQGLLGVIDPVHRWQATFPTGWFVPAIDPDERVPGVIPFTPTPFVSDNHIVLSRPEGYWKGEIGVFARGP